MDVNTIIRYKFQRKLLLKARITGPIKDIILRDHNIFITVFIFNSEIT